jgi:predicted GNAT superfamily acetyltransferase
LLASPTASPFTLRLLKTWEEFLAAEELQRIVWQMPDWRDAVPANFMIAAQKCGGMALGAFDSQEHLIGLAFSFIGLDEHGGQRTLRHHSHMLAVLPEYRAQKLGAQLKFKQREIALAQNIELVTWTYDPLLALNANLNLVRLGAMARRYYPNAYGEMTDGLNAGLASDRFEVEWWLNAPRVERCAIGEPPRANWDALVRAGAQEIFDVTWDAKNLPHIQRVHELGVPTALMEIPVDLGAVKLGSLELAQEWRTRTRDCLERAFASGYAAIDFVFSKRTERPRAAYVLSREPLDLGIAPT